MEKEKKATLDTGASKKQTGQKEIKFSEEEMGELTDIQHNYIKVQNEFGQVNVTKLRLQQQLDNVITFEDDIKKRFIETQSKEKEFVSKITEIYGDGQLDTESGIFIKK